MYRGFCDISVATCGYYELASLDNLASAHKVNLNNIPERAYKNKAILCLKLSDVSEDVRFTVAVLLNEVFVTLFPESYHYITATINRQSDAFVDVLALLSPVQLCGFDDEEAIYIIEDSEIDLGLLVSVERNFTRLLEIIADYLTWHNEKLANSDLLEDTKNLSPSYEIVYFCESALQVPFKGNATALIGFKSLIVFDDVQFKLHGDP